LVRETIEPEPQKNLTEFLNTPNPKKREKRKKEEKKVFTSFLCFFNVVLGHFLKFHIFISIYIYIHIFFLQFLKTPWSFDRLFGFFLPK